MPPQTYSFVVVLMKTLDAVECCFAFSDPLDAFGCIYCYDFYWVFIIVLMTVSGSTSQIMYSPPGFSFASPSWACAGATRTIEFNGNNLVMLLPLW